MADLPADLRLRRELIQRIASVLQARMQREELTLRQVAEMLGVSHPRIADLLAKRPSASASIAWRCSPNRSGSTCASARRGRTEVAAIRIDLPPACELGRQAVVWCMMTVPVQGRRA